MHARERVHTYSHAYTLIKCLIYWLHTSLFGLQRTIKVAEFLTKRIKTYKMERSIEEIEHRIVQARIYCFQCGI